MAINKTVNEIQMQAYGAMQHTLRKMSKEDNDRYAAPGTEGHDRHTAKLEAVKERADYRAKAIAKFKKENEVVFGSFRNLTEADIEKIKESRLAYERKLKAFVAQLDKDYPSLNF